MEIAISAARFVVSRALGPVSDGLLESWEACSDLSPNVSALKLELLYAQAMLDSAIGLDVRNRQVCNPALGLLLLELRHHADRAEDVLDELDYFRIHDEDVVELRIWDCLAIQSLPKATLPSSLTKLDVCDCESFRSLPKESLPSSLTVLSITFCPAIRSLHNKGSGSLPSSLQTLDVSYSNEKLQRQCRKLIGTIPIVKVD